MSNNFEESLRARTPWTNRQQRGKKYKTMMADMRVGSDASCNAGGLRQSDGVSWALTEHDAFKRWFEGRVFVRSTAGARVQARTSEPLLERKVQRKVDALFVELRRDTLTYVRYACVKSSFHSRRGVALPCKKSALTSKVILRLVFVPVLGTVQRR